MYFYSILIFGVDYHWDFQMTATYFIINIRLLLWIAITLAKKWTEEKIKVVYYIYLFLTVTADQPFSLGDQFAFLYLQSSIL
jgi:hypothetical protein